MPMKGVAAGVVAATVISILVAGCGRGPEPHPASPASASLSDVDLARLLPTLADYPGPSWDVSLRVGAFDHPAGPNLSSHASVEPAGCSDIPFQRGSLTAASSEGSIPNGIAGDSGEAAVRIMRERAGSDLIAESVAWARRCHEYREVYRGTGVDDPTTSNPTAVSVMSPIQVAGVEVTRIHLTDNRANRFQAEGSREAVVSMARVGGLVVVARRHDDHQAAAAVLGLAIQRLSANEPAPKPSSDGPDATPLNRRADKELERMLPTAADLPAGWDVRQSSPIIREGDDQELTSGCARVPFENRTGWRTDLHRDFREVASASASRSGDENAVADEDDVRLAIEDDGVSVIDETITWAKECAADQHTRHAATVELLPASQVDGLDVTSVHVKGDATDGIDYTASLLRVRGVLVVTRPALSQQHGPLARTAIDTLRHARFDTPATGPDAAPRVPDQEADPVGNVTFPAPSVADTTKLARVARGVLVDSESYHFGGYLPGDAMTRSADYLHFRSPSGAIACTWRKFALGCDVPRGAYRRTPRPVVAQDSWSDTVSVFGPLGIESGVIADDPVVYATSNVLPYGSTIRLDDDTACLMEPDGLTCVDYRHRTGMHLSRDDLTPLSATDSLVTDTRLHSH